MQTEPKASSESNDDSSKLAQEYLEGYRLIDERVRGWIVLYGIGLAALFATQAEPLKDIDGWCKYLIVSLALFPPLAQLTFQILYKFSNHANYVQHKDSEKAKYPPFVFHALRGCPEIGVTASRGV
jgi:hypothetical protein